MKQIRKWLRDKKRIIKKDMAAVLGFLAFIAVGGGLIVSTMIREDNIYKTEILIIYGCFFGISLVDHFYKLLEEENEDKSKK